MDFVFIDFETLSNIAPVAPIISMGAIVGNWDKKLTVDELRATGFYRNVNPIRQIKEYGLKTNPETLDWWAKQGAEARKVLAAKDKIEVEDCLDQFTEWCLKSGVDKNTQVFIRASHFDWVIYENLMRLTNRDSFYPLSHWNVRDVRTICDIVYQNKRGYMPGSKDTFVSLGLTEHNALDDCIKDYIQVVPWYGTSDND